jgi:predicted component of type VI protein secretion system
MLSLKLVRGTEHAEGVRREVGIGVQQARFLIGRDPGCDWPIPDRTLALSARHCEIVQQQGRLVLRDLSTNGTFVNGAAQRMAGEHLLRVGDRIGFGPYLVEVHPPGAAPPAPRAAAPARAAARGGDPAAVLPGDWEHAASGSASPVEDTLPISGDVRTGFTRIERPPPRGGAPAPGPAPGPAPAPAPAPSQAPPGPAPDADPLAALAHGLGVPPDRLAGRPAGEVALRAGQLLRVVVEALRRQLEQQARTQRQMGSRDAPRLGAREASALRLAASTEDAIEQLLAGPGDSAAALQQGLAETAAHAARLHAAAGLAARRLGAELAPEVLERLLGEGGDPTQRERRLWTLYTTLWPRLGGAEGAPWAEGFAELASLYLAAAYDDQRPA